MNLIGNQWKLGSMNLSSFTVWCVPNIDLKLIIAYLHDHTNIILSDLSIPCSLLYLAVNIINTNISKKFKEKPNMSFYVC